jgi:YHS domain-containing protein
MFGKGVQEVVCIVSGGKGTMPVSFEGQTYYVCCTGCRDYFNENAAAIVAEYASKKKN